MPFPKPWFTWSCWTPLKPPLSQEKYYILYTQDSGRDLIARWFTPRCHLVTLHLRRLFGGGWYFSNCFIHSIHSSNSADGQAIIITSYSWSYKNGFWKTKLPLGSVRSPCYMNLRMITIVTKRSKNAVLRCHCYLREVKCQGINTTNWSFLPLLHSFIFFFIYTFHKVKESQRKCCVFLFESVCVRARVCVCVCV